MQASSSIRALWASRILATLVILFLLLDGVMKLVQPAPVVASFAPLGLSPTLSVPLGIVLLVCVLLYVLPQTAVLGAILLTGYLGGAVAIHVRAGNPLFTHILFPVFIGIALWLALWLRLPQLRAIILLRR